MLVANRKEKKKENPINAFIMMLAAAAGYIVYCMAAVFAPHWGSGSFYFQYGGRYD